MTLEPLYTKPDFTLCSNLLVNLLPQNTHRIRSVSKFIGGAHSNCPKRQQCTRRTSPNHFISNLGTGMNLEVIIWF